MTFRHIKNSVFKTAAFFALILIFTSCGNLFDDVASAITNRTSGGQVVMISGNVSVDYQAMSGGVPSELASFYKKDKSSSIISRAAIPDFSFDNGSYYVKAYAPGYSGEVTGSVNEDLKTFSIPLSLNYQWTIELGYNQEQNGNSRTVLKGTYRFNHRLTESDVSNPVSISLRAGTSGTGSIGLDFEESSLFDDVIAER